MNSPKYDFRQFQEELAALERKTDKPPAEPLPVAKPPTAKLTPKQLAAQRLATAREEFLALRKRYELSVADVIAFFPEEEGIAYLEQLIAAARAKPTRTRKKRAVDPDATPDNP